MIKFDNLKEAMFKLLILCVLLINFSSCKKAQTIDDSDLGIKGNQKSINNILDITSADVSSLRMKYLESKNVYLNQYGSLNSFAAAVAETPSDAQPTYKQALNVVLSDKFIASILNDNGEIIVDNTLFKVTVFGTFKTKLANRANLEALINQISQKYKPTDINVDNPKFDLTKFYSNGAESIKVSATALYDNGPQCPPVEYISMVNDVDYYPTFSELQMACDGDGGGGGGGGGGGYPPYTPPTVVNPNDHPMFLPGNMTTENMVNPNGSFWTTMFQNATHYNDFDSEYRTSVLFYNRNYGFIKTLGIKVKQQKDGWFWYNATNSNVISAGWETITYVGIPAQNSRNYYATVYPAQTHYYDNDVLPDNIQIMRISNSGGTFYMPLIVSNELPIPSSYASQGKKGIIKFIWDLIKKKIESKPRDQWSGIPILDKDGNDTYERIRDFSDMLNKKLGAMAANAGGSGELEFTLPAMQQFAYNTDMIDIPLDDYHSDVVTAGTLLLKVVFDPSGGTSNLWNFTKDELNKSFKVKEANVYGSSTRNNMWRGVRVVHN